MIGAVMLQLEWAPLIIVTMHIYAIVSLESVLLIEVTWRLTSPMVLLIDQQFRLRRGTIFLAPSHGPIAAVILYNG